MGPTRVDLNAPVPWYRWQAWTAAVKIANSFGGLDLDELDLNNEGKFTYRSFAKAYDEAEKEPSRLFNFLLPILKTPAISAVGIGTAISGGIWYFWSHFNRAAKWIGGIASGLGVAGIAGGFLGKKPLIGMIGSSLTSLGLGTLIPGIFHNAFKYIGGTVAGIGILAGIGGAFLGFKMKPEIMEAYKAELNPQASSNPDDPANDSTTTQ